MIARMTDAYGPAPDSQDEACEFEDCWCKRPAKPLECGVQSCPPFEEVTLTVEAVCDCSDFMWPGNPDCALHGQSCKEAIQGWNAAVEVFEGAWRAAQEAMGYEDMPEAFRQGWRTAVKLSMNIGADLRAQEPGVARVPR